jgi:hypothetical protein
MMEELKAKIKQLYPSIDAFCRDAKISRTRMYELCSGKAKLTPIMKRRILLALKARERM